MTIAAGARRERCCCVNRLKERSTRALLGDERRRMDLGGQWHAAAGVVLRVESGVCSVGQVCCGGMKGESWHGRPKLLDSRLCSMVG